MQDPKEAIDQIVRLCSERGLSLRDVCAVAKVNIATVNRWRNGTSDPRLSKIVRMYRAIDRLSRQGRAA
jgi:transcriptional regulator with XRE-family HTH domain